MASILRGVVIPPYGGDTLWTNLVAAYEDLSLAVRNFIDGLQAVHVLARLRRRDPRAGHDSVEAAVARCTPSCACTR